MVRLLDEDNEIMEPETLRRLYPDASEKEIQLMLVEGTIRYSNSIFEDHHAFEKAVRVINKKEIDFRRREGCLVSWIWYAIKQIKQWRPQMEFSHEVAQYVKYISESQGVFIYPPELELENPWLETAVEKSKKIENLTDETIEDIQASKYLMIQEYLKKKKGEENS